MDPALTSRQRGQVVRDLASREHQDPDGKKAPVSRRTIDLERVATVPVGHRVGVPRHVPRWIRGERERIIGNCHPDGRELSAAAAEAIGEQLTGQKVQGQAAALTVLRGLLDPLALLD
ncbi:MAG: hypothetical protein ACRDOA_22270 [Streptosporangiaceae bacterium]